MYKKFRWQQRKLNSDPTILISPSKFFEASMLMFQWQNFQNFA